MPELPEIYNLARQMRKELHGRVISEMEIRQEKCLNVPVAEFKALLESKTIDDVRSRGKWVFVELVPGAFLLLSLGMGGDVLLLRPEDPLPDKYQVAVNFTDGWKVSIRFWWFGYAHAVTKDGRSFHKMTVDLGISPLDDSEFTFERFHALLDSRKCGIKSLLMDQKNIAGIGNLYVQDILFRARLHPNRKTPDIGEAERRLLYSVIKENLTNAAMLGGFAHEKDLYGQSGRFADFLVGYKEGQPCPECGCTIEKIKTGSTAQFICPSCQK